MADAFLGAQRPELSRRDVHGAVDGAELEVLRHRVWVGVQLEDDLVDLGLAGPVGRVRLEAHELALLPLHELEGPVADDRRLVLVAGGRRLAADLAPDVLRQDRDDHPEHVRLGRAGEDLDVRVVDDLRPGDAVGVRREIQELVVDDVVEGERHVAGGDGDAVLPHGPFADGEDPLFAVLRDRPLGGELRPRLQVLGVEADEEVVVHVPEHVVDALDADERVQVVRLLHHADVQRELLLGRRAGRGGGAGDADRRRQQEQQDEDQRHLDERAGRPSANGHADPPVRSDRRHQASVPWGRQ